MAMFWWGPSPKTEIRHHLHYYPACNGKCKPILLWMLQGLNIEDNLLNLQKKQELEEIYSDHDLIVVYKPAGMLSVPGKNIRESVLSILKERYPKATGPMIVHRLDMATSGLLVVTKNLEAYINLQKQFAEHTIKKRYVALLEHIPDQSIGIVDLPLLPDIMDRPRQKVDKKNGKKAITKYQVIAQNRVWLYPLTGRTHQLRMHCAHEEGLNNPILGDNLYGKPADRLYLHAEYLEFTHPSTGKRIHFEYKAPF
jgi:tRNA pseudouridine32 synthase/23S rRNA pseudouridine746 synthase